MTKIKLLHNTIFLGICIVAIHAIVGFSRDFFFVGVNNILWMKFYPEADPIPVHPILSPLSQLDYSVLYYLKFPFTLLWTVLYFGLNRLSIKFFVPEPKILKILLLFYVLLLSIAIISSAFAYIVYHNLEKDEYTLSRWLMGIAQSPLPALLLIASSKLLKNTTDEQTQT